MSRDAFTSLVDRAGTFPVCPSFPLGGSTAQGVFSLGLGLIRQSILPVLNLEIVVSADRLHHDKLTN